jgi:hypothetical protein
MKIKPRITSILHANHLDTSITGYPTFNLSALEIANDPEFQVPTNLRLGHLAEKVVAELIKASTNYEVLHENIQLTADNKTIGEIDFIIVENNSKQLIHMELAYKFYLYDPHISSEPVNNWIGPNRNDSLREKLDKLHKKQFPLLHLESAKSSLQNIAISKVTQACCFLVSLFVPYEREVNLSSAYEKAIRGYYLNVETFLSLDHSGKAYYIPSKREWGIAPSDNDIWTDFGGIEKDVVASTKEKRALLCWQKQKDSYSAFFIVWW